MGPVNITKGYQLASKYVIHGTEGSMGNKILQAKLYMKEDLQEHLRRGAIEFFELKKHTYEDHCHEI